MTAAGGLPWRVAGGCVIVRVRLTPKSSQDDVDGLETTAEGPAFKARVRAVPENGAANEALEKLMARWLDVARSRVSLAAGGKSRIKSIRIDGDAGDLDARLAARLTALA